MTYAYESGRRVQKNKILKEKKIRNAWSIQPPPLIVCSREKMEYISIIFLFELVFHVM